MEIAGKSFIVTGAGSGLGAATAVLLASAGGNVIVADINGDTGAQVASQIGDAARFVRTDVTDEASVREAVAQAVSTFGALHGVANCAGIGLAMKVLGKQGPHPLDAFARTIQVNLVGTFNVIRLAAVQMATQAPDEGGSRGVFVNTASVAAFDGQVGQAAYSASKGGIVGMTLPIARDLAPLGIRVVTIAPGIFDTPLLAALPEAARQSLGAQVPFPSRLGRPPEYAALVRHVIENDMLNGEVIRLDGALRMAPR
jgi:NAD(P)-dependent dehydrogenase (short-subunit alcohol dehydrogenase family)